MSESLEHSGLGFSMGFFILAISNQEEGNKQVKELSLLPPVQAK